MIDQAHINEWEEFMTWLAGIEGAEYYRFAAHVQEKTGIGIGSWLNEGQEPLTDQEALECYRTFNGGADTVRDPSVHE